MTRFVKGRSGNPAGRPRKSHANKQAKSVSPFTAICDQVITVREGDTARERSAEEALHLKTYQKAIAGSRLAQRAIMKMIAKREAWHAKRRPAPKAISLRRTYLDEEYRAAKAMEVLGMASSEEGDRPDRLLLEPWIVVAALERRRASLGRLDRAAIRVGARDWPSIALSKYCNDE